MLSLLDQLAMLEYGTFLAMGALLAGDADGDGHPVLVLPGFAASDRSTGPLRSALRRKGYATHGWNLGLNIGPHRHIVEGLDQRLTDLHRRYGGVTVSLVGWSLGGVYARELARLRPDAVRQVITLASPYRMRPGDRSRASMLYNTIAPRTDRFLPQTEPEEARPPVPVPATSIYTRTDSVVRWHTCIDTVGPGRENIEVIGTHNGLGVNVAALLAVADRLAQPEGGWAPFRAPHRARHLFPRAASWRPPSDGGRSR
jgi:pimeloyl-ACP methyl ester carboxylesterase